MSTFFRLSTDFLTAAIFLALVSALSGPVLILYFMGVIR